MRKSLLNSQQASEDANSYITTQKRYKLLRSKHFDVNHITIKKKEPSANNGRKKKLPK
jgi:hypothetical protein